MFALKEIFTSGHEVTKAYRKQLKYATPEGYKVNDQLKEFMSLDIFLAATALFGIAGIQYFYNFFNSIPSIPVTGSELTSIVVPSFLALRRVTQSIRLNNTLKKL